MLGHAWEREGTKEELEKYVGNGFKLTVGWIESKDETTYVQATSFHIGSDVIYRMYVWNVPGARAMVASMLGVMLGAPVRSE